MATATVVPAGAVEALPKELGIGIPGTKDAWARMDRDIILNATRQSLCFTEQMYWFLILTSRCGPTVRDGCFLRDHRGYVVRDQQGQEIPVRQKHVCEALQVENRSLVHKTLRRLVDQKRVTIGDDGIWYPVMDPAKLAELLATESVTGSKSNKLRKTHYIGIRIPDELLAGAEETVTETIAGLEKIDEEFATAHKCLLQQHRAKLQQYISDRRIIIDEKIEEIREEDLSSSSSSDTELETPPEPTTTTAEPKPSPNEPEPEILPQDDPAPVIAAALNHHRLRLSQDEALRIVQKCRDKLPELEITPAEVARYVCRVPVIREDGGIRNPPGFLVTAVAKLMDEKQIRFYRAEASPHPPAAELQPEPDEDREMESNRCPKCGGLTTLYASGRMSWCRCEAMKRATR